VAGPLKDISNWVERYRKFWEESFDRLDAYLRKIQTKEKKGKTIGRKKK
jgi:hypothetical protein